MKEFGLDVNKIKAVNLDALYKFLSTNVDENGKPLIDSLITFYQSATSNAKTTSALFSKTKPQYMNEFIEKRNKELAPLGKTFFGIMGEEGYKKITHESMAGQLFE
ncbi:MAG TPA: hypothetical protein P5241_00985 [Candidatus Paceibacterota bacterium]|jgi:hypothetical protein|nr:hypothetical protein [Candidatus Paceibacterota bacterium]